MPRGVRGSGKKAKKANGKAKAAPEAVQPSEVKKMPSANKIKELARLHENRREQISEITGEIGSAFRTAKDNQGVHLEALRQALKEKKKEAGRLADFYAHLDYYRDVLGLLEKAASAPRLDLEEPAAEPEETGEGEETNIEPFPVSATG